MYQLPLFAGATQGELLDDACGRVTYTPRLLAPEVARDWFARIRAEVEWKAERRWMYERKVAVPRLLAHFALHDETVPETVRAAARLVTAATRVPYDSVGLNLYRDGRDSVAPHNDHLDEIAQGFPIALLSLGATRRMAIRAKPPRKLAVDVDLEPGSLLLMSYATQLHYTHAIPKTKGAAGERISLAFRVKPRDEARAGRSYG